MTPTRILHVMNVFSDSSISRIVERVIRNLKNRDCEWHVSALDEDVGIEAVFKDLGAKTVHFPLEQNARQALRSYILRHNIDVVHTHTPRTIIETHLAARGMRRRPRHVATKHLLTTPKDRRWGIVFTALDYFSLYLPDHLAAVSGEMAKKVAALPGMDAKRVSMVRNAVPCEQFYQPEKRGAARLDLGFGPDHLVFGYAGRIEPVKLIDLLIRVFGDVHALHPNTRLVLIGEGGQRAELEQYTRQLGLADVVSWLGYRGDIPSMLAAMDVYVQPSHNEGLSLSILEAMAAGKPVIATDVGGIREVLTPSQNGLLVEPHSPEALFKSMTAMASQPDLRMLLGEAARKHVVAEFSLQKMVDAYGEIYQSQITGYSTP
jgi:glycosyltransferase involved in cell wall biosynthesis